MMKRRHFNLIKTGRKSKLALAVGLALAMSAMGSVFASGNDDTFKNFANKDALMKAAEGFKTQEFKNSTGLEAIGADKAYALGYSGAGVGIGLVDTPVWSNNSELNGKVYHYGFDGALQDRNHGTFISGIIAAKKDSKGMHGIAFDSEVYSIGFDNSIYDKGKIKQHKAYIGFIDDLPDKVKVVNNSWGAETGMLAYNSDSIWNIDSNYWKDNLNVEEYRDFKLLVTKLKEDISIKNRAYVWAAGNMGELGVPTFGAGVGNFDELKNNTVNVISGNLLTDTIASNSNIAENAYKYTVVAPGNDICSIDAEGAKPWVNTIYKKENISATSYAAPYVSATLGLIQEAYPYMNGKEMIDTLFSTANTKFGENENYVVLFGSDNDDKLKDIKIIYCDKTKHKDDEIKSDLIKYFNHNKDKEKCFKEFGIDDIESFLEKFKNQGKVYYLKREQIFGQGVVDAGKAVQGLGAIDVDRLSKDDITTKYSNEKFYMYKVDTKKVADNFRGRNYSIWSNDIGDKNVTGINAGLEKTGDVKLILLGENTYGGATVAKGGFLQIVRGVGGDVYVGGDSNIAASAEINGYAKNIYALESGKVKISDIVSKNYANVDADFLAAALPDTNKVDINGGLFAIGKNSITGEGSTINVNLTRSDSAIKGALYQDELGKINLSLANEAKFILQQGTGYYAGNSYKSNDTINNLRMDSFATFDMSQDGVYSTLKIDKLQGRDGQFILGTDLANCNGDSIFVTGSDAGEHWISIVDKNSVYADNEDGAKKVLVATTPDNVKFKGLALAQDMGVNQYNFTPNIYYDENIKGWYFNGFRNTFEKPSSNTSWIYTTNDVINKGIHIGNDSINVKVIQKETPAMIIRSHLDDKYSVYPIVISKNKYLNFVGDGAIEVYNNLDDLNNGDKYFNIADSSAILNDGDINVHQRIILTSKNEDKNTPVGIYRSIENYGNLSFFNELEINHSVNYSHTSEAIYNLGKIDIGKKFTINISADTNINSPTGIYNGYETKKGGKYIFGEINAKDDSFITITDDLKNKSLRTATAIENKGKMIFEKDLNVILPGNTSTGPCSWDYADGIENNGIHFTYSDSPWSPTYSVDEGSYFEVKD